MYREVLSRGSLALSFVATPICLPPPNHLSVPHFYDFLISRLLGRKLMKSLHFGSPICMHVCGHRISPRTELYFHVASKSPSVLLSIRTLRMMFTSKSLPAPYWLKSCSTKRDWLRSSGVCQTEICVVCGQNWWGLQGEGASHPAFTG